MGARDDRSMTTLKNSWRIMCVPLTVGVAVASVSVGVAILLTNKAWTRIQDGLYGNK